MPFIVLLVLLLLPGAASAQVYKCKGKSGETAYSEYPCDAKAQPMKLRDERAATAAASAPPQASDADEGEPSSAAPAEADRTAERACIAAATASIYGPSNDRVATYQQQMAMLNEQLAGAPDAQRRQALNARMATLRQAITGEHAKAHQQINAARKQCVEQHRAIP